MGQALYRKYRSKTLGEIVGQEHITDTLSRAVKDGRISHAYLFTGPRGVGKTSIARILAHEINGLPYKHEDNHIDIIEIDAASNRGIDEIRDLREKVYMAPVAAQYKVYIIDEVHMLTTQAFNALLKTLEEPPAHVVFILATTEAHKLPETIISRTQRHIFRPVETDKVVAHLRTIAAAEKILIDDDALELFATQGGGSFRDSISLLDQARGNDKQVSRAAAEAILGIPPAEAVEGLLQAVASLQPAGAMQGLGQLERGGFSAAAIAKQVGSKLRASYVAGAPVLEPSLQWQLMRDLLDVAPAHDATKVLELALLRAIPLQATYQVSAAPVVAKPAPALEQPSAAPKPKQVQPQATAEASDLPKKVAKAVPEPSDAPAKPGSLALLDATLWPQILEALKSKYNTLYGVMRMAVPEFSEGKITLRFRFSFHQKRMNEAKHRTIVSDIIKDLTGSNIAIECLYDKEAQLSDSPIGSNNPSVPESSASIPPATLATISNIFGGGELIES